MKQIIQDLKSGKTILEEVPSPKLKKGYVLIKTKNSLVSLGTEKMLVDFGKANYLQKAKQQPEKVKQVINKIKTDGLIPTLETVFRKLNQPLPLGYCNSGVVIAVGENVNEFKIGDRVASNGNHAEVVNIPQNLVAKVPDNVSFEDASFTVIASIGLQGIRLLNPTYGENVVVIGLGLIGLITAQLLKANGCNVIGIDYDQSKLDLASSWGVKVINASNKDEVSQVLNYTNNIGSDGVLITASTKQDSVISNAAKMCRKRGKVVLVGVIGLNLNRLDFYEKEISFQVSCSYGPGRYDVNYEEKGMDYPVGYVRWTEKRNFEAILNSLSNRSLNVKCLVTEKVELNDFEKIYSNLSNNKSIASIIEYNSEKDFLKDDIITIYEDKNFEKTSGNIGIIGAGNFTAGMIVPVLKKLNCNIKYIASSNGLSGTILAKKYKIPKSVTDYYEILNDNDIDGIIITTRHDQHSSQVLEGLRMNKHVFVEKPLALNINKVNEIQELAKKSDKSITVGFNRRFSPFTVLAKKALGDNPGSINVIATMNAGAIPADHWVQDMKVGGGRIIGEACHYIDLISHLCSSNVKSVFMSSNGLNSNQNTDNACIVLKYENGALGVLNYFSNGHKSFPKERIEIYQNGNNIVIDNFKKINFYGFKQRNKASRQDKGHTNQFKLWNEMLKNGGKALISFDSIINTTKSSILALESLKKGKWINVE